MEYALLLLVFNTKNLTPEVLILVLMEYALLHERRHEERMEQIVLILVLMEYALLLTDDKSKDCGGSLNPCSNGICSLTKSMGFDRGSCKLS